jgi:hypothetical protein
MKRRFFPRLTKQDLILVALAVGLVAISVPRLSTDEAGKPGVVSATASRVMHSFKQIAGL